MATVLGEITMEFSAATVTHIVEVPLEPSTTALATATEPVTLWLLALDLPPLITLWGPLLDLSWRVEFVPDALVVVPLPAAVWMFAAALLALATRVKRRAYTQA